MALIQGDEDLGWPSFKKLGGFAKGALMPHTLLHKIPGFKKIPGMGLVSKYSHFAVGGPGVASTLLALKNRKKMGRVFSRMKGGR